MAKNQGLWSLTDLIQVLTSLSGQVTWEGGGISCLLTLNFLSINWNNIVYLKDTVNPKLLASPWLALALSGSLSPYPLSLFSFLHLVQQCQRVKMKHRGRNSKFVQCPKHRHMGVSDSQISSPGGQGSHRLGTSGMKRRRGGEGEKRDLRDDCESRALYTCMKCHLYICMKASQWNPLLMQLVHGKSRSVERRTAMFFLGMAALRHRHIYQSAVVLTKAAWQDVTQYVNQITKQASRNHHQLSQCQLVLANPAEEELLALKHPVPNDNQDEDKVEIRQANKQHLGNNTVRSKWRKI